VTEFWLPTGIVHSGFARALDWISKDLDSWLADKLEKVLFTGHSLGAALATLAASKRPPMRLVTFGSPYVGDAEFAETLRDLSVTRYVNCCDLVTRIPPLLGFRPVGERCYVDHEGTIQPSFSENAIHEDQSAGRESYLLQYTWRIGNVAVRDLADHAPLNYVAPLLHS
jgi:pimeloyl-ACP methyl ester carboxylesterase